MLLHHLYVTHLTTRVVFIRLRDLGFRHVNHSAFTHPISQEL